MKAIYNREILSYHTSFIGSLFTALMLAVMGIYFVIYNLTYGYPYFGVVLEGITFIYLVSIPLLTMRSFAEERRNQTDQLLLTSGTPVFGIVMGKYLAMVTILAIPCFCGLFFPWIIKAIGTAYIGADYAALLCFFLMGCVFIAVGMYMSSLTENQMIAAVSTFGVLFVLYMWDGLTNLLPSWLQQRLGDFLGLFSVRQVMVDFVENYLFNIKGLMFYLSLIVLFIFLTIQRQEKRRWS